MIYKKYYIEKKFIQKEKVINTDYKIVKHKFYFDKIMVLPRNIN